ncbi:MAG TPA: response regulator transcription factor [Gaiellaceae bacterium]|nr:response regulator transcription factor [Gaiellaceae bacterium]
MTAVRCLVADDHPALTAAVWQYLAGAGYAIVGAVADGRRAVDLAAKERPDVAVVDYRMPMLAGAELVAALLGVSPGTTVCVYTAEADEELARDVIAAGAAAVVLKESPLSDLARALANARAGRVHLDPALRGARRAGELTERELEVLHLLAEGLPNQEIGRQLGIGSETVRTHLRKASERLGASTRTQAVATALRLGLIS